MFREAVDVNREVVVGDDVLAGARVAGRGTEGYGK